MDEQRAIAEIKRRAQGHEVRAFAKRISAQKVGLEFVTDCPWCKAKMKLYFDDAAYICVACKAEGLVGGLMSELSQAGAGNQPEAENPA